MTGREAAKLRKGDTVTWIDPDDDVCTYTGVIKRLHFHGEIITITFEDDHVVGCLAHELEKRN